MSEKSFALRLKEREAGEKFDYFICGIAGALFAYLGQTYSPHKYDSWHFYLMPAALVTLTISFSVGSWAIIILKRITGLERQLFGLMENNYNMQDQLANEGAKEFITHSGNILLRSEMINLMKENNRIMDELIVKVLKTMDFQARIGFWRNVFLALGFIFIMIFKFSQPLFS